MKLQVYDALLTYSSSNQFSQFFNILASFKVHIIKIWSCSFNNKKIRNWNKQLKIIEIVWLLQYYFKYFWERNIQYPTSDSNDSLYLQIRNLGFPEEMVTEEQKLEHLNLINSVHKFDKSTYLNFKLLKFCKTKVFFF